MVVDGKDYMSAVADAVDAAKKEIFITDWKMNPHIVMKRPDTGVDSLHWRLDKMLLRKTEEGVRVYILLYWEAKKIAGMDLGSEYTQSVLKHSKIEVHRHPDMNTPVTHPTTMLRWSHHEKVNLNLIQNLSTC
jgi:phospholipase D1/2